MGPAVLPLLLCALGATAGRAGASWALSVEPAAPAVEYGGSLVLTLRSTCREPNGTGNVETPALKRLVKATPRETVVELLNVTEWNSSVLCFYRCRNSTDRKTVTIKITVYRAPDPPVLEPVPALPVGATHELACAVSGAAPLRLLTVTLRRGAETLRAESFARRGGDEPAAVRVTHRLTARRAHHGHNVTCTALLDLSPYNRPRFTATSDPRQLAVYEFPEDPVMEPQIYLETGEAANASCAVTGVFPAARFELTLANRSLPVAVSRDGHRATAELAPGRAGAFALVCNVSVGPKWRWTEATVHVYRFPRPQLDVGSASAVAGAALSGRCVLAPGHSAEIRLRIRAGRRVLAEWGPAPLAFATTAREEDDGLELSCDAKLPAGGKAPKSSAPVRLNVTAPPRMDNESCPPQQNWTEGQDETLRCWARGNPRPEVTCTKEGEPFPPGVPQPVTRAHAGTYRCRATNPLGTDSRDVTVGVDAYDPAVLPWVLVALVGAALLAAAGAGYGIYYRQKKIRHYRLRQRQEMERLRSEAPAALNGSAREAQA